MIENEYNSNMMENIMGFFAGLLLLLVTPLFCTALLIRWTYDAIVYSLKKKHDYEED